MLPEENKPWPPAEWEPAFDQYATNRAWRSNNLDAIAAHYGGGASSRGDNPATHLNKGGRSGGVIQRVYQWFVGQPSLVVDASAPFSGSRQQTRMHVPVATNLSRMSANRLMGEPPVTAFVDTDGRPLTSATSRTDRLFQSDEIRLTLSRAAEQAAGLSAVALTAHWDRSVSDVPWVEATPCTGVVPEWSGRRLVALNLWTTYPQYSDLGVVQSVLTHVERHEIGAVVHALYKGTASTIGIRVPITSAASPIAHLAGIEGTITDDIRHTITMPTGITRLTAAWWPNRPTVQFEQGYGSLSNIGAADAEGAEQILDSIDMTWSSWMRDIKLARARLIIPEAYMTSLGEGRGNGWDDSNEILQGLNYLTGDDGKSIESVQFKIRHEEHSATFLGLLRELVNHAGYSMSGYGYDSAGGSGNVTATEINDAKSNTAATDRTKQLTFKGAWTPLALALRDLDVRHYGGNIPLEAEPSIEFEDSREIDPLSQAQAFQAYRNAMAASIQTLVRERNPDWDQKDVEDEVLRIKEENGLNDPEPEADPAGRFDAAGNPIEVTPVTDPEEGDE